jgi:hypothetical protein
MEMATTKKTPVQRMKDQFGDKEKLVDHLLGVLSFGGQEKEKVKEKLLAVSNKKLLRMLEVGSEVKQKYGSPEKLAEAVAAAVGKAKDKAYLDKLGKLALSSPARLLDILRAAQAKAKGRAA